MNKSVPDMYQLILNLLESFVVPFSLENLMNEF